MGALCLRTWPLAPRVRMVELVLLGALASALSRRRAALRGLDALLRGSLSGLIRWNEVADSCLGFSLFMSVFYWLFYGTCYSLMISWCMIVLLTGYAPVDCG